MLSDRNVAQAFCDSWYLTHPVGESRSFVTVAAAVRTKYTVIAKHSAAVKSHVGVQAFNARRNSRAI